MNIDLLFLGGTSIDLIPAKSLPSLFEASVGGSITNSAIISAKLGLNTALFSKIGDDLLGSYAISQLKTFGINTKGILKDPCINTAIAIADITSKSNTTYKFYKNSPKDSMVTIEILKNSKIFPKIFHFGSSYSYQDYTYNETLKYVKYLKKNNVFISYDPNIRPYTIENERTAKKRIFSLLNLVNLAKLSEIDLNYLLGIKDPKKGLRRLKKQVKCQVVLTLGSKGAIYHDACNHYIEIPAFKVKVADTIGAGDAFISGLLYGLNRAGEEAFFNNIQLHLTFASAVSAIICTKHGSHKALKNLAQVKSFLLKNHSKMI